MLSAVSVVACTITTIFQNMVYLLYTACWSSQFTWCIHVYMLHVVVCGSACFSVSFQVVTRPSLVWRTCAFTSALTLEKGHIPASLLAVQRHSQTRQIVPSISEHIMSRWSCIYNNCLVIILNVGLTAMGICTMHLALLAYCMWFFPTPPIIRNHMPVHTLAVPKGTLTQVPYGSMSKHMHCQGRRYPMLNVTLTLITHVVN